MKLREKLNKKITKKAVVRMVALATGLVVIIGAGAIVVKGAEQKREQKAYEVQKRMYETQAKNVNVNLITEDEAVQIALSTAGLKKEEVRGLKVKLDREDDWGVNNAMYVYEVEFTHEHLDYEFEINAESKEVIHSEVESKFD